MGMERAEEVMPSLVSITSMSVEEVQNFFGQSYERTSQGAGTGIIIGENMRLDKRKVLVKLCKDKCIPCFRTYTMKSWNEIAFAPYDLMESEKTEYITPGEMKRYIQEGLENGRCSNNERMIFNALNEKVLRKEHY